MIGKPVHLLSPFAPSMYLLVGPAGDEFGDHPRYTIERSLPTSRPMLAVGVATPVIPLAGRE